MTDPKSIDPTARPWKRRPRYAGKNPRAFHEKYKELDPARYGDAVQKVLDAGKTPAGSHRAIMVEEVLDALNPAPGKTAIDCTLGFGGHARALLARLQPGGRLVALDVDPIELPRTEARLRQDGFGPDVLSVRRSNFAGLLQALEAEGLTGAQLILADLGVSSMQLDNPDRGFTYRESGPLDMRMNPTRGEPAAALLARMTEEKLVQLLTDNSDEPYAERIAAALVFRRPATTSDLAAAVRDALDPVQPRVGASETETSVRRTFQALRIAVNDEFSALDTLLRNLPAALAPGGRVAIISFHSGEDRRVKKAFQSGERDGIYSRIAPDVIRPSTDEVRGNPRATSAKLRWAHRSNG